MPIGPKNKKRKLESEFANLSNSASKTQNSHSFFGSPVVKYKYNSPIQTERVYRLMKMITGLMLPVSIVEKEPFREYINFIDPSFAIPSRSSVKNTILPQLKSTCQNKIKNILNNIPSLNTSMDAWTDAAARPFNGFVAQGIDLDWQLHSIPIEFDFMDGN